VKTRTDLFEAVAELIEDIVGVPHSAIDEHTMPDDVDGWDSLRHLTLITAMEERFDIVLSPEEQSDMLSVELILDILADRLLVN
jgi:acyl carrier protein